MSKNVLIISSSPRKGGNSDTLANEFMRGAMESGNNVEKVALREKTINYCTGCGQCTAKQKPCWQKDDANEVIDKMLAADIIVLVTPVYFYAMSGQMKTMIDRTCGPYVNMKGKHFYFLATAAEDASNVEHLNHVFDNLMGFIDCLEDAEVKDTLLATGVYEMHAIDGHPALEQAYVMGKNCE